MTVEVCIPTAADLNLPKVAVGDDGRHRESDGVPAGMKPWLDGESNLALLWQRYMPKRSLDGSRAVKNTWKGYGVLHWFATCAAHLQKNLESGNPSVLAALGESRRAAIAACGVHTRLHVSCRHRLALGLANPAAVENSGVSLQHPFGFPILPGAGLKGLCRHYFAEQFAYEQCGVPPTLPGLGEQLDGAAWKPFAEILFGNEPGSGSSPHEGTIAFHDGWPIPSAVPWFDVDVLTSHHQKYYGSQKGNECADDTDGPNPVHFLTVSPGVAFEIPLGLTSAGRALPAATQQALLLLAERVLILALDQWGIGGRTGAGYGQLHPLYDSDNLGSELA